MLHGQLIINTKLLNMRIIHFLTSYKGFNKIENYIEICKDNILYLSQSR